MDLNFWKTEAELKKYLDNLGIEYRYGCFEENNPETCHLLGDYLLSIQKERSKAAQLYKNNCDNNKFGLSCDAFGRMACRAQGMAMVDYQLALEYFIKGCNLDEPRACYHGGQMFGLSDKKINKVIKPDPGRALEMLTKSCRSGKLPAACTLAHSFCLRGFHGKPPDLAQSADFAKTGCDQDEFICCTNLSRMYHLGEGVEADQDKSTFYGGRAKDIKSGVKKNVEISPDVKPDA